MSSSKDKLNALHAHGVASLHRNQSATPLIKTIPSPADIGKSNGAPIIADREEPQAASIEGHDPMGLPNRLCNIVDSDNLVIHVAAQDDIPPFKAVEQTTFAMATSPRSVVGLTT